MCFSAGELVGLFHAGPGRPRCRSATIISPCSISPFLIALTLRALKQIPAPVRWRRYTPSSSTTDGSIAALITGTFRRNIAYQEGHRGSGGFGFCPRRREDHIIRIDAVLFAQTLPEFSRRSEVCHQSEVFSHRLTGDRHRIQMQQTKIRAGAASLPVLRRRGKARTVGR